MNDNSARGLDDKTHILIGYAPSGKMTVICRWPRLPRQTEVQRQSILCKKGTRHSYYAHQPQYAHERQRGERAKSSPRLG